MDCGRAREELGWQPARTRRPEALNAFLHGVAHGAGEDTAPLAGRQIG